MNSIRIEFETNYLHIRQYEEERNLKLSRRNEEKRARTERSIMEITANDREDELNFMRKKYEIEERIRKLMEEKRNDQLVKDKVFVDFK